MCNQWCLDFANKLPPLDPSSVVIELGARNVNGSLRNLLEKKVQRWVGVDITEGSGVDILADAKDLRAHFPLPSFDLVVSTEMLEHCPDWRTVVRETVRVLKPGGILLLTTRAPGFELHDYPGDYNRFTLYDLRRIFTPLGSIIAMEHDMTLGWPCGVGIIVRRDSPDFTEKAWAAGLADIEAQPADTDPHEAQLKREILFDQYSRHAVAAGLAKRLSPDKGTVLDVGSGYACLLQRFLPQHSLTFLDPLLSGRPDAAGNMLAGLLPDPRLAGKAFDLVTCIDVLEHVPPQKRREFLQNLCAHADKSLVLMFPADDYGEAGITDAAMDKAFLAAHQRENIWLREHQAYGLPKLKDTLAVLAESGWRTTVVGQGHAPWLRDLLPVFLVQPTFHPRLLELSEEFNTRFQQYDLAEPCYRAVVIAARAAFPLEPPKARPVPAQAWREFIARGVFRCWRIF
jgi:SAM-dependent methyltransferase